MNKFRLSLFGPYADLEYVLHGGYGTCRKVYLKYEQFYKNNHNQNINFIVAENNGLREQIQVL